LRLHEAIVSLEKRNCSAFLKQKSAPTKPIDYVDKTSWAIRLINQGKYFFLSRPQRFGKSLF